ncbi:SUKH-4 family immunity protein [Novipirellula caenicola]|uniref:SUKH-4 family immunity protein n=1 Tax=Novipirellula caenicola TaxID=1536901 RepID=UPI0031ED0CE7
MAAELRHPCRKRLPSSFRAGFRCIIVSLVSAFRFDQGRRRPHNPLCDPAELIPDDYEPLLLTFHEPRVVDGATLIGSDAGGRLEMAGERIVSHDHDGEFPLRFVNSSIAQLQSCIHAHRAYAESVAVDDGGVAAATFADAILKIDPECLVAPENWWAVVLEQIRDGQL